MANNLYEFYTGQGQNLPSVQDRAKIFETSGLGASGDYQGTAQQNTRLLNTLSAGGVPQQEEQQVQQQQPQQQQVANTQQSTVGQAPSGGGDLVSALIAGGYNQIDAENAARLDTNGNLRREYLGGGAGGVNGLPEAPSIDLTSLYDNLTQSSGVSDLEAKLTQMEQGYNQAVSKINDNPYLSEANRVGRIQKLTTDYQNSVKPIQGQISTATADVQTQLSLATQQYGIDSDTRSNAVTQFNNLLAMGALVDADANTIASLAASTGLSTSMIQSAITASQQTEANTQVIKSEDNQGNVTVSVIDQDTGEVISQQSLGAVGSADKPSSPNNNDKDVNTFNEDALAVDWSKEVDDEGNEVDVSPFMKLVIKWAKKMTLDEIYTQYIQSSLGQEHGQPSEERSMIEALYSSARGF